MKRVLFFALAIAVAVSLVVLPAFASETYIYVYIDESSYYHCPVSIPRGKYELWSCTFGDDGSVIDEKFVCLYVLTDASYDVFTYTVDNIDYYFEYCDVSQYEEQYGSTLTILDSENWERISFDAFYLKPVKEPVTMTSLLGSIGDFFTTSIHWLGDVLAVVISSPALSVAVIAVPLVLFAVTLVARLKQTQV